MSDVELRLSRVEARLAIGDLVARYCAAVDDRDFDAIAGLFTEDAYFGHVNEGGARGRSAIRDYYRGRLEDIPYSFHYPHTHTVDVRDSTTASGEVTAHAEMARVALPPLVAALRYTDDYRFEGGAWRFARRELRFFYFAPVDEVQSGHMGDLRVRWPGPPRAADLPA
jgi:uncharacterized protein (TIGR02246 family)